MYEIKYDGYRLLARVEGREVRLFTRSGKDWTRKLPRLAREIAKLGLRRAWLDGEIVILGAHGTSSFQRLQNAFEVGADADIVYYVFDLPYADGQDLRALPLLERKRRLAALIENRSKAIRFSDHLEAEAEDALAHACRLGLEGLIGKRADAGYVSGRTRTWIKLKCRPRQEFVIGGYTDPAGSRHGLGALLVGLHDESGDLRYAGRVGTGFDDSMLADLTQRLGALTQPASPFKDVARLSRAALRGVHWVRPELVAEVAYAGWTDDRVLRQASFVALRADKPAAAVREERAIRISPPSTTGARGLVKVAGVAISHPDRVIWREEGITKADLARYYEAVGPKLIEHLRCRPLSLLRCPDGTAAQCFFQRHLGSGRPEGVKTFVWDRSSKGQGYLYVNTIEAVIGVVQHGSVELHTWGATVPSVRKPDRITIDLDPDPALPWKAMVEGARLVHTLFEQLGLRSFLKTTGGKGLHIVVPLVRRHTWAEVKSFAHGVATHLERTFPDRFVAKASKARRQDRIFVDYLRNGETATAVAAFSARARPGAPISMPVPWTALAEDIRGTHFNVRNAIQRLAAQRSDPWADYARTAQRITRSTRQALGLER
jgi:bifunctional non-homologous end joining protein LigD